MARLVERVMSVRLIRFVLIKLQMLTSIIYTQRFQHAQ